MFCEFCGEQLREGKYIMSIAECIRVPLLMRLIV